jgi:hypothetical protein
MDMDMDMDMGHRKVALRPLSFRSIAQEPGLRSRTRRPPGPTPHPRLKLTAMWVLQAEC